MAVPDAFVAEPITHVIFDLDGLLLDSETLYTESYGDLCQQFGVKYTIEIKRKQMGRKPIEALQMLIDEFHFPVTLDAFREIAVRTEEKYLTKVEAMPGAYELLDHLSVHNIPMCIASGSDDTTFDVKMRRHPKMLAKMTHFVLAGSDEAVVNGKPAPDCFLVAASRFVPPPAHNRNALVFEDSSNGVRAALAAGMRVVWVPNPIETENTIQEVATKDVTLLRSLHDFKPELFGLPRRSELFLTVPAGYFVSDET